MFWVLPVKDIFFNLFLYDTVSPGNISHEYPQNTILDSASGFINNDSQTLYHNILANVSYR